LRQLCRALAQLNAHRRCREHYRGGPVDDKSRPTESNEWIRVPPRRSAALGGSGPVTLKLALQASGLDDVIAKHRPRLMSDNGPSYIANDLSKWLGEHDVKHTRGKPYHPMT